MFRSGIIICFRMPAASKAIWTTHPFWFWNNWRLTSKTVFSRPIFAPWYNPTWCSQRFKIITSLVAMENKADLRSKSWSSPRSRPSVPSTSITSTCMPRPRDIQIPLVVWLRLYSSITSNEVPKSRFRRVPLTLLSDARKTVNETIFTYFCRYFENQILRRHCTQIQHPPKPTCSCSLVVDH